MEIFIKNCIRIEKSRKMWLLLMTMMFLGEVHAGKNEGGAEDEIEGDLFAEYGPSEDDCDYGIEIDVVGANEGSKLLENPIPCEIASHGGDASKEQEIGQQLGLAEDDIDTKARIDHEIGNH